MSTFAAYLNDQLGRDDAIGYLAKYWHELSPGRISAVSGIERALRKEEARLADPRNKPEDMAPAAWERSIAVNAAALAAFGLAVDEYHKNQAIEVAHASGVRPEDMAKPSPVEPVRYQPEPIPERARNWKEPVTPQTFGNPPRELPQPAGKYTGWPEERFDRIEAALARIERLLVTGLTAISAEVTFARELDASGINWRELHETADFTG